jgi:hypothetical protein
VLDFESIPPASPSIDGELDPTNDAFAELNTISQKYGLTQLHSEDLSIVRSLSAQILEFLEQVYNYWSQRSEEASSLGLDLSLLERDLSTYRTASAVLLHPAMIPTGQAVFGIVSSARLCYLAFGDNLQTVISRVFPQGPQLGVEMPLSPEELLIKSAHRLHDFYAYFFRIYAIKGNSGADLVSADLASQMQATIPGLDNLLVHLETILNGLQSNLPHQQRARDHIIQTRKYIQNFLTEYNNGSLFQTIVGESAVARLSVSCYHTHDALIDFALKFSNPLYEDAETRLLKRLLGES